MRRLTRDTVKNIVFVSDLVSVESFSAFARVYREGKITATRRTRIQSTLLLHMDEDYLVVPLEEPVLTQARALVDRYPLRASDAIQLASAQYAVNVFGEPMTFITADKRLSTAAAGEGFAVDDPNAHP